MKKFTVQIDTVNAAFGDEPEIEVARLLRELADKLESGQGPLTLYDINGNRVGGARVTR